MSGFTDSDKQVQGKLCIFTCCILHSILLKKHLWFPSKYFTRKGDRKDTSTLDFPLLTHSGQYRLKNLNLEFSSFLAVVENNSNWKGTQNSSFAAKNHRQLCVYVFLLIKLNLCYLQARWCSWPCHRREEKTAQSPGTGQWVQLCWQQPQSKTSEWASTQQV